MNDRIAIIKLLKEKGVDINAKDKYSETPLHATLFSPPYE
ncbi:MAG: hypothetical protein GY754_03255 [bacterium]|nr:hypothetical protein [bacterium]